MSNTFDILQNRFREITVNLERVDLLTCDENWRGDHTVPPFSSIGLILKGTGTIFVDQQKLQPAKGQLYLLPARTTQTFFNDGRDPYVKYYCHFHIASQGTQLFDLIRLPLCINAKKPETAATLFADMLKESQNQDLTSFIKTKQRLLDVLSYYLECCPEGSVLPADNDSDSSIQKAITYVQTCLPRSVSVRQMAEIAGYHPSHFAKLFQKSLGMSPTQFLIRRKAQYAMDQLVSTSRPIADIAESLEFSSQFYFCNFFKKQTGMTPSEYRHVYFRKGN